jgi:hypothetical protein
MQILKYFIALTISLHLPLLAMAEEGGSGHYMPGSMSSFIDGVPGDQTFIVRLNYLHYDGSTDINRQIPIAGMTTLGAEAVSDAYGLTALWAPDWNFSDTWSYAMSATIPWVEMDVEADVSSSLRDSTTVSLSDQESGFGDIILMPLMLNQKINKNLNANYRLAIYAPTGEYEVGQLANTGKNFWTVEPTAAIMYLGQENGIEASLFFGMDFNTENNDTDYKSGIQAHLDGTLAQHFPLWKGIAGAGLNGFWYQQISDDSGDGANLGAFRAQAHGVGPVLSYTHKALGKDIIAELKWLYEFDNVDRLEGNTIFFKILAKF